MLSESTFMLSKAHYKGRTLIDQTKNPVIQITGFLDVVLLREEFNLLSALETYFLGGSPAMPLVAA
jgi:hypothetical protein